MRCEIRYFCSFCGGEFKSIEECAKHEKSHTPPVEIAGCRYERCVGEPYAITIKASDGRNITYEKKDW